MENKDEFKKIDIKNRTYYYLEDITRIMNRDIDFREILLCEKLCKEKYQNILIYDISYKTFMSSKSLRIMFHKIDGFIKIHDGIRYLVSFGYG